MRLLYSIADQFYATAASTGIYNISLGLLGPLASEKRVERLTVLANTSHRELLANRGLSCVLRDDAIRGKWRRVLWEQGGIYRCARRAGGDWLLLPKGYPPAFRRPPLPLALYIHDIIPMITADRYGGPRRGSWLRELLPVLRAGRYAVTNSRLKQRYFTACYRAALSWAGVIFTNTAFTRRDIIGWAEGRGLTPPPVVVAGYGFDGPPRRSPAKSEQLAVMIRDDPHKRADLTVDYLQRWKQASGYPGRFVAIGRLPGSVQLPDDPAWEFKGLLAPAECQGVMAQSRAVIHFSEYEGFGMVPVEAVLNGTCPVFSGVPATMEAMGDTGCPFETASYASFAQALDRALKTPPDTITAWAKELADRHTWTRVARRIVDALADVAGG